MFIGAVFILILVHVSVVSATTPCTISTIQQHQTTVKSCTCTGNLQADTVNTIIQNAECGLITLTDCTLDRMVTQVEKYSPYEAHFILQNCILNSWQANYLMDSAQADLAVIRYLELRNVTMRDYSGWKTWTRNFEVDGRLQELLRFDNSLQLLLNADELFMYKSTSNYEIALSFNNMDLSSPAAADSVRRMLTRFNKEPKELKDLEKGLFLNNLTFQSTRLTAVPAINVSVQAFQVEHSVLSFSGNLIRNIRADSFASYKVSSLVSLDLSANVIESIDPTALDAFRNLRELDLSRNRITALSLSALKQPISYLNVSNNGLTHLDWPAVELAFLGHSGSVPKASRYAFDLHGNPWNCSCALLPLVNVYKSADASLAALGVYQLPPKCADGQSFLALNVTNLCRVSNAPTSQPPLPPTQVVETDQTDAPVSTTDSNVQTTPPGEPLSASKPSAPLEDPMNAGGSSVTIFIIIAVVVVAVIVAVVATIVVLLRRKRRQKEIAARGDTAKPLMGHDGTKTIANKQTIIQLEGRGGPKQAV